MEVREATAVEKDIADEVVRKQLYYSSYARTNEMKVAGQEKF